MSRSKRLPRRNSYPLNNHAQDDEPATKRPCLIAASDDIQSKKTTLYNISNDCFSEVLDYLHASSLAKLVETGYKMFCGKVLHCAHRFDLVSKCKQSSCWPTLVSRLYNLRHVSVVLLSNSEKVITLDSNSLSSSLLTLQINGLMLQIESHRFLLPTRFPLLQSINFVGTRFFRNKILFDGTTFRKQITNGVTKWVTRNFVNLDSLVLPGIPIFEPTLISSISTLLQTLVIGPIIGSKVDLSHLDLKSLSIVQSLRTMPILLPPTLTDLAIHTGYTPGTCINGIIIFPPSLTRLRFHTMMSTLETYFSDQQTIMPNVRICQIVVTTVPPFRKLSTALVSATCRVLPNVASLRFCGRLKLEKDIDLSCLPKSLTEISSCFMARPSQWKYIPKSCRVLKPEYRPDKQTIISTASRQYLRDLPDIVESIQFEMIGYRPKVSTLPRRSWIGLSCVDIARVGMGKDCILLFIESLPSSVVKLRLSTRTFVMPTATCFDKLVNLTTFGCTMAAPKVPSDPKSCTYFDAWLLYLPHSIQYLFLAVEGAWSCSNNDFGRCRWPTEMRALDLFMRQCIFPIESVSRSLDTATKLSCFHASFDVNKTSVKMKHHNGKSYVAQTKFEFDDAAVPNALEKFIPRKSKPFRYRNEPYDWR